MIRRTLPAALLLVCAAARAAAQAPEPAAASPAADPPPPAAATAGAASDASRYPVVREITFQGNEVTRPSTMLRETVIHVGEPADPDTIERSRQGIQDLGLFKKVTATQVPLPDGGVRVVFTVVERWYVLPLPRYDVNSEGERGYGLQLRWYNVWGLNHTLRTTWSVRDEKRQNTGDRTSYNLSYDMPFLMDSPWRLTLSGGHMETPVEESCDPSVQDKPEILGICTANAIPATGQVDYSETVNAAGIGLGRSLSGLGPASVGWSVGTRLQWTRQDTAGALAPRPHGQATALGFSGGFRDVRNNIYSEHGRRYGLSVETAVEGLGSDYSYSQLSLDYAGYWPVGETPHQTVHLFAGLGSYHGGPLGTTVTTGPYSLGGASVLRGYPGDYLEGDAYYYVSGEYVRPVIWNWLRVALIAEAGNVFPDLGDANLDRVYASVGASLRLRFTFLVDLEVEAGIALPLDGNEQRFFASRV